MCVCVHINIYLCVLYPIKNLTELRSGESLGRIMKFSSIWCHFCNNIFLKMKINLLFNATIRSLFSRNQLSFPQGSDNGNKRFPNCLWAEKRGKKCYTRHVTEKSATRSTDAELLLDGFLSLKCPQKKSLTRKTRISVLTEGKNKKNRFNFSYLVFLFGLRLWW